MSQIQQVASTDEQKKQPARGFDSYGLVACLVISIFFIVGEHLRVVALILVL